MTASSFHYSACTCFHSADVPFYFVDILSCIWHVLVFRLMLYFDMANCTIPHLGTSLLLCLFFILVKNIGFFFFWFILSSFFTHTFFCNIWLYRASSWPSKVSGDLLRAGKLFPLTGILQGSCLINKAWVSSLHNSVEMPLLLWVAFLTCIQFWFYFLQ